MRTKLFIGAVMLMPGILFAAGLGKIKTKSALGEPLRAEVEVLESYPDEIESVVARLANSEEYAVAGLSESMPAIGIRCTVLRRNSGNPLLLIRSDKPVKEPFLELLIKLESRKANVDLMRQYTVLLEPAGQAAKPQSESDNDTVVTPVAEQPADTSSLSAPDKPVAKRSRKHTLVDNATDALPEWHASAPTAVTKKSSIQASGETYTTQSGDIFGKVAQKYQPPGVPLKKVMSVMFKLNPDAFENGKMRKLKAGVVLQIPTPASLGVETLSTPTSTPNSATAASGSHDAGKSVSVQSTAAPDGVLSAVAPVKQAPPASPAPNTSAPASDHAVDVNAATATDASQNQGNANAGLATSAQPATASASPAQQTETAQAPSENTNPTLSPEPAEVVKPPAMVAIPKPVDVVADQSSGKTERGLMWRMVLMLTLTISLCVAVAVRFFRKHTHRELYVIDESLVNQEPVTTDEQEIAGLQAELEDDDKTSHEKAQEILLNDVDPVVEADVLMSYGHDEKAESILNQALKSAPQKPEISIALLKVYAKRENKAAFEFLANKLYDRVKAGEEDSVLWDKVVAMGAAIDPENPLYQGQALPSQPNNRIMDALSAMDSKTVSDAETVIENQNTITAQTTMAAQTASHIEDNTINFTLDVPEADTSITSQEQQPLEFELVTPAAETQGMVVEHVDADFDTSDIETIVIESAPKRRKSSKITT